MCFPARGNPPRGGAKAWSRVVAVGGLVEEEAAGRALSKLQSITQWSILLEPVLPRSSPARGLQGEPGGKATSRWSSLKPLRRLRDVMCMAWVGKRARVATLIRQRPSSSRQRWRDIETLSHNLFHAGNCVAVNTLSLTPRLRFKEGMRVSKFQSCS